MHKSFIISIVYPPTTPAFSHPSFPRRRGMGILSTRRQASKRGRDGGRCKVWAEDYRGAITKRGRSYREA